MDALLNRAELLLLKCRKELVFDRLDELKKKYNKEQGDVLRMEGNLLAKLRRDHEERLEEEKQEVVQVQLELEMVEKELADIEQKILVLESVSSIYNAEDLDDTEKELDNWCEWAKQAYEVLMLTRKCMDTGKTARLSAYSGPGDREKNLVFQENMGLMMEKMTPFLLTVGRVRFLPGMRMKTIRGTRRNLTMNGKTLAFFWKDHPSAEIDILDFDLRELYGSWAVGDTLDRKLKELEELESLVCWIVEEKLTVGKELLRKVRINRFRMPEKDVFGFEKEV